MILHPNIDPVLLNIGPLPIVGTLSVHWYGIMYLLGFAGAYLMATYRVRHSDQLATFWTTEKISDLIFYCALGAVLGGRLGYILFYKAAFYLENPVTILKVWEGGMSFHGGLLGVSVGLVLFANHNNRRFLEVADFVAPLAPIGLFFGRIGNFINQELWGKTTDLPWGVVFTNGGPLPRHPSMLYEALLEGVVLFIMLLVYANKTNKPGCLAGLFLVGYAVFRFMVEFVRVPDAHLNYLLFNTVTMGQLLCLPMLVVGIWLLRR